MIETIRVGKLTVLCARPSEQRHRPVLFVHGFLADAQVWTAWLEFFAARGVPAYAVNLRGRGGSNPAVNLGHVSIDDYAADAAEVARSVGATAVVGHSMGGLVAQKLAERGIVNAAVLITPAPPRGISVLSPRVAIRQLKYLPSLFLSRVIHPSRKDLRVIVMNRVPEDRKDALLDMLVPDSGLAAREMSIGGVPIDRAAVRCPMLVVAAEHDLFVPARIVARIARRYDAELETVTGRGHMIILEPGWEQLAERVQAWIAQHQASGVT